MFRFSKTDDEKWYRRAEANETQNIIQQCASPEITRPAENSETVVREDNVQQICSWRVCDDTAYGHCRTEQTVDIHSFL